MEIQGKIIKCGEVRSGTSERGNWMTQEFVLEHGSDQWKRKMVFEVFGQDRLQRFAIKEGQMVNVSFDIDAREWNGRFFNQVRAFDVRQRGEAPVADAAGTAAVDDCPFGPSMS